MNGRVYRLRDRLDELEAATFLVTAERPEVLTAHEGTDDGQLTA